MYDLHTARPTLNVQDNIWNMQVTHLPTTSTIKKNLNPKDLYLFKYEGLHDIFDIFVVFNYCAHLTYISLELFPLLASFPFFITLFYRLLRAAKIHYVFSIMLHNCKRIGHMGGYINFMRSLATSFAFLTFCRIHTR